MSFVLSLIAKLFGAKVIWDGITIAQAIAWLQSDEGKTAAKVFGGVVKGLVQNGDTLFSAGLKAFAMIAKVHKMTPEEEKIWADRGLLAADDFHDFPQEP